MDVVEQAEAERGVRTDQLLELVDGLGDAAWLEAAGPVEREQLRPSGGGDQLLRRDPVRHLADDVRVANAVDPSELRIP